MDERDGLLLVMAKAMIRETSEVYDCLLGSVRSRGTSPDECKASLQEVVEQVSHLCVGRQGVRLRPLIPRRVREVPTSGTDGIGRRWVDRATGAVRNFRERPNAR